MEMHEKVARQIAEWACMSDAWEEYLPKADALLSLFAEDRRELVKALVFLRGVGYCTDPKCEVCRKVDDLLKDAALAKEGAGG